jgi:hypothetical protein
MEVEVEELVAHQKVQVPREASVMVAFSRLVAV